MGAVPGTGRLHFLLDHLGSLPDSRHVHGAWLERQVRSNCRPLEW
jgi:hypothetical protein